MTDKIRKKLKHLQQVDFKPWITTFWLIKRHLVLRDAHYSVLRLDIEKKLQTKLKNIISNRIQNKNYKLEEYEFLTADQDDQLFTIDASETDFSKIQTEIDKGLMNKKAEKYEDLLDSWAYVVKIEHAGNAIYGLRKINKFTRAAKMKSMSYFIFENKELIDLEDKNIFTIDIQIDLFVYEGTTFITNKKEFESALNFRQGMENNRDTLLDEFNALKFLSNIDAIRNAVGTNLHLLRRISAIQKSGYYKDKTFIKSLVNLNQKEGWGLTIKNGVIVVDESNVELVLTLLNNSRLRSPINQEVFDATVKKKVR